ncbi:hypothetical protein [Rhizobium flavescens]|uniref:hypothetical protein n=1 Tax=Rhizobium flavescens TaxID=2607407 RepID=UPI00140BCE22|nr:hypothetical protein [Rhizobium flavescens]
MYMFRTLLVATSLAVIAGSNTLADPLYIVRPISMMGGQNAGVLPNDAFSNGNEHVGGGTGVGGETQTPGGGSEESLESHPVGPELPFSWTSNSWKAVVNPIRSDGVTQAIMVVPPVMSANASNCVLENGTTDHTQMFSLYNDSKLIQVHRIGRYGLVIHCETTNGEPSPATYAVDFHIPSEPEQAPDSQE